MIVQNKNPGLFMTSFFNLFTAVKPEWFAEVHRGTLSNAAFWELIFILTEFY